MLENCNIWAFCEWICIFATVQIFSLTISLQKKTSSNYPHKTSINRVWCDQTQIHDSYKCLQINNLVHYNIEFKYVWSRCLVHQSAPKNCSYHGRSCADQAYLINVSKTHLWVPKIVHKCFLHIVRLDFHSFIRLSSNNGGESEGKPANTTTPRGDAKVISRSFSPSQYSRGEYNSNCGSENRHLNKQKQCVSYSCDFSW